MAGSYPDVPGRRMGWDKDGTIGLYRSHYSGNPWTEMTPVQRAEMNDEDNATAIDLVPAGGSPARSLWLGWLFPELREFDGFMGAQGAANNVFVITPDPPSIGVYTSPDTTNGFDGAWTVRAAGYNAIDQPYPTNYRTAITSLAVSSIRGVRWVFGSQDNQPWRYQIATHLYGVISPGQTPNKLLWIDQDTGLEFTADHDWGDVPRGSSADKTLRLRNDSATQTAINVQYTAEALYLESGGWYTFTLPGGSTFQATRQIASIPAATTTGIITVRRIFPSGTLGLHAARVYATVDTWS